MFSAFRPKANKAPTQAQVIGYDGQTLELSCPTPLKSGLQTLLLLNQDLNLQRETQVLVEDLFPEKQLYWASLPEGHDLGEVLQPLIPLEAEVANNQGLLPPQWEEKRSLVRLQRVIGVMSPQVAGFRCTTFDFNCQGLRLLLDNPLEPGSSLKLRFELEDHRLKPFDLVGRVIWCSERSPKGYWAGILFSEISAEQSQPIDKFVEQILTQEGGVLTRDYILG